MNNTKTKNRRYRKITGKSKIKAVKDFKAVECVRNIRDNMYKKNKNLSMKDYVKKILNGNKFIKTQ